jgi:hypothetical protein
VKYKKPDLPNLHEMLNQYRADLPTASQYFAKAQEKDPDLDVEERLSGSFKGVTEDGTVFQVDVWFEDGIQHRKKSKLCDYDTLRAETATSTPRGRRDRFSEAF